jgi:hypothetical protein
MTSNVERSRSYQVSTEYFGYFRSAAPGVPGLTKALVLGFVMADLQGWQLLIEVDPLSYADSVGFD